MRAGGKKTSGPTLLIDHALGGALIDAAQHLHLPCRFWGNQIHMRVGPAFHTAEGLGHPSSPAVVAQSRRCP
jgi:hypothetical protein